MELSRKQLSKIKEWSSGFTGKTFCSLQRYCSSISNFSFGIIPIRIDGKIRYMIKIVTLEKEFYCKVKEDNEIRFMVFSNPIDAMEQCINTVFKTGCIISKYAFLKYNQDLTHLDA